LAQLAGADEDLLARNAVVRDGVMYKIRGQALNKGATLLTYIRLCPRCAAEDIKTSGRRPGLAVQNRVAWQIASIRTCPVHNVALVNLGVVSKTNEIHDFAGFIETNEEILTNLDEVERQPSALELYLHGRLDGASTALPFLDSLDFHAAAKLCEMIGAVVIGGRDVKVKAFSDDEWRKAGGAGFAIVKDGEPAIRTFLSDLQASFDYKRAATEGPQAVFGAFYKWLAFSAKDEPFAAVLDIVRRHVIETTPMGPGDELFGQPVERRILHSIYTASREFQAHPKRLRKILAAKGLLPADHAGKADNHVLFDAEAAQALYDSGAVDGLSLKELETYSGAGRVQAKLLADSGFLKPVFGRGDISDASGALAFARKDVDNFLAQLLNGAQPVADLGEGQFDIPAAAKRANCSAAEIIRLILARKLAWVGRLTTREKYMAILVDVDEVKTETRNLPPLDGLTARQAEKTLHYASPVVRALIDHNILATEDRVNPVNRCPVKIIKIEEIDRFRATYVSLVELAAERGMHPTLIKRFLDEDGIKPALGKAIFQATFYRRSQL
jgi:hypothetical protein